MNLYREMLRAKIHRLTVTETNVDYEGSITLDEALLEAADILPGEKVHVVNVNNGNRFETYTIPGARNSGVVCLNGAAAHLCNVDDIVIVMAYAAVEDAAAKSFEAKVVYVDSKNRMASKIGVA